MGVGVGGWGLIAQCRHHDSGGSIKGTRLIRSRASTPLQPTSLAHLGAHTLAAVDERLNGRVRQHAVQHGAGELGGAERRGAGVKLALSLAHQRAQLCGVGGVGGCVEGVYVWGVDTGAW